MPCRNGYEVLGELRQDPRYAALPIIALTASAMQGDREKALAAGFTGYLAKPVALAHLREEIQRLLQPGNSGRRRLSLKALQQAELFHLVSQRVPANTELPRRL